MTFYLIDLFLYVFKLEVYVHSYYCLRGKVYIYTFFFSNTRILEYIYSNTEHIYVFKNWIVTISANRSSFFLTT